MNTTSPTPYPDVNDLLLELLSGVQTILGDHFIGMYLFGSLASGDFDQDSDVDVVVIVNEDVSGELFSELKAMHGRIAAIDSPWAIQLEVSYIPQHAIRRHDPTDALHPHIDRGERELLRMMYHDMDWIFQRHNLRERGLVVKGPAPYTLIDPVSPNELRQASLAMLRGWVAQILDDPVQVSSRGFQSFTVLTLCRILYTLEFGADVSKQVAARWVQETVGERWNPLIERAWEGRQNPHWEAGPQDVNGTMDFIRYALERGRQLEIPSDDAEGS